MALPKSEPNIKIAEKTMVQLKEINSTLSDYNWKNTKVLISIAVDNLHSMMNGMTVEEFFAFIVAETDDLQDRGFVKDNARSIGKKDDETQEKK